MGAAWPGEQPVLCLMGPTASGKSRIALALAARFPLEIVSVDSALVYRGMDIGTAKPGPGERQAAVHHLIDVVDPTEAYSAARFADEASALVAEIRARDRIPLLTGGTMLYFKALREGLSALPPADPAMRLVIDGMAAELGWPALHATLATLDEETAARLEPADSQRIQRALEVCWLTGRPMSELLAEGCRRAPPWPMLHISIEPSDRLALHQRIEGIAGLAVVQQPVLAVLLLQGNRTGTAGQAAHRPEVEHRPDAVELGLHARTAGGEGLAARSAERAQLRHEQQRQACR